MDGLGSDGGLEIPITDEPGIDNLIVGDRRKWKDFNAEGNEVGAGEVFRLPDGNSKMAGGNAEVGEVKPRAVGAGLHDFVVDDLRVHGIGSLASPEAHVGIKVVVGRGFPSLDLTELMPLGIAGTRGRKL